MTNKKIAENIKPIIKTKKGIPVFEPEIEKSSFGLTNSCASDQYAKDVNID